MGAALVAGLRQSGLTIHRRRWSCPSRALRSRRDLVSAPYDAYDRKKARIKVKLKKTMRSAGVACVG
jgi:hypothetical protein